MHHAPGTNPYEPIQNHTTSQFPCHGPFCCPFDSPLLGLIPPIICKHTPLKRPRVSILLSMVFPFNSPLLHHAVKMGLQKQIQAKWLEIIEDLLHDDGQHRLGLTFAGCTWRVMGFS